MQNKIISGKKSLEEKRKKVALERQKVVVEQKTDFNIVGINMRILDVTYSVMDHELVEPVVEYLKELNYFDEILETQAGGVITSHCGPATLGVLFYAK